MSRIGKKPILIPGSVEAKIEGNIVTIKGPKGELQREVRPEIGIEIKEKKIFVGPQIETKKTKALWGLTRALISNMVKGVTEGYEKKLEIRGLGFRAVLEGKESKLSSSPFATAREGDDLILYVGFTHPIKVKAQEGIKFSVEKNIITVSGIDKGLVSQIAANIRKARKPEPYKGKGIRYLGEVVRRKVGKRVVTAG